MVLKSLSKKKEMSISEKKAFAEKNKIEDRLVKRINNQLLNSFFTKLLKIHGEIKALKKNPGNPKIDSLLGEVNKNYFDIIYKFPNNKETDKIWHQMWIIYKTALNYAKTLCENSDISCSYRMNERLQSFYDIIRTRNKERGFRLNKKGMRDMLNFFDEKLFNIVPPFSTLHLLAELKRMADDLNFEDIKGLIEKKEKEVKKLCF